MGAGGERGRGWEAGFGEGAFEFLFPVGDVAGGAVDVHHFGGGFAEVGELVEDVGRDEDGLACGEGLALFAQAHFSGAFDAADYDLRRPRRVCAPVDKNGEGIKNSEGYLICYPAKVDKFSTKHVRRFGIHAANQFGDGWILDTIKEEELCVPSRLTGGL